MDEQTRRWLDERQQYEEARRSGFISLCMLVTRTLGQSWQTERGPRYEFRRRGLFIRLADYQYDMYIEHYGKIVCLTDYGSEMLASGDWMNMVKEAAAEAEARREEVEAALDAPQRAAMEQIGLGKNAPRAEELTKVGDWLLDVRPFVYFAESSSSGEIKIGCTRRLVGIRLRQIGPVDHSARGSLKLLGTCRGGFSDEDLFQQAFGKFKCYGPRGRDWFRPSARKYVLEFLSNHSGNALSVDLSAQEIAEDKRRTGLKIDAHGWKATMDYRTTLWSRFKQDRLLARTD